MLRKLAGTAAAGLLSLTLAGCGPLTSATPMAVTTTAPPRTAAAVSLVTTPTPTATRTVVSPVDLPPPDVSYVGLVSFKPGSDRAGHRAARQVRASPWQQADPTHPLARLRRLRHLPVGVLDRPLARVHDGEGRPARHRHPHPQRVLPGPWLRPDVGS